MEPKCRLCLSEEKLIWVFDPRIINTNKLSDIIHNATGIHISDADPVTQMVCHECCLYTVDIYKFRVKCLINNNLLHSFADRSENKVKLELPVVKNEVQSQQNTPTKRPRKDSIPETRSAIEDHNYYLDPKKRYIFIDGAKHNESDNENYDNISGNTTVREKQSQDINKSIEEILYKHETASSVSDAVSIEQKNDEDCTVTPDTHRLMVTRSKRRLKSDIERRKYDKQRFIESLYAENIDKIMFTSYLKLAPKYDIAVHESSSYNGESGISCKLCKTSVDLGSTLREHLEQECKVFKMIDNLPTVNLVRMEDVPTLRDCYPGVLRQIRAVKKERKFKCPCCDDDDAVV